MNARRFYLIILIILLLSFALPVSAQSSGTEMVFGTVQRVIECGTDIRIRFLERPSLIDTISTRKAVNSFMLVKVMLEYMGDEDWDGLDSGSFELITTLNGEEITYGLDYTTTTLVSSLYQVHTLMDDLTFPSRYTYYLLFDVKRAKYPWTLHFAPKNRGTNTPVCDLMLALPQVQDLTTAGQEQEGTK